MINENYKKRLQKLAGIISENAFVDANGNLSHFSDQGNYIPGDKKFKYSITYQKLDPQQGGDEELDGYTDQGFEIKEISSRLGFIIEKAKEMGINSPSSSPATAGMWWNSNEPENSRDYFEKGIQKFYSLHLKNLDGSPLSKEESEFITKLLNAPKATWKDWDITEKPKWNGIEESSFVDTKGQLQDFDFNDEVEIMGEPYVSITIPTSDKKNLNLFYKMINQGIDSNLEGFTKSIFGFKNTSLGKRIVLNFHKDELPILIKRLVDEGSMLSLEWAEDIKNSD